MARGRTGFMIEGWKLGIYLGLPLLASWYYNDPARQKASANYWKFVEYPPNPTTGLKEKIMEHDRLYSEQRQVYKEQLQKLDQLATQELVEEDKTTKPAGFWARLLGKKE